MMNKMTSMMLLLLTLNSCKKDSSTINHDDKGSVPGGGDSSLPLTNVYLLAYQGFPISNLDNMMYRDKNPAGQFRSYDTKNIYGIGIHNTVDGNTSEGFNFYGIAYLSNNRTRVVYLKKDTKELLADKLNLNLGPNYDEYILAKEIFNGDLYLSVKAWDFNAERVRNYCYKIAKNGIMSVSPLTEGEYYGLEFMSILPSGVITATGGSHSSDGRFRIYRGQTELAAIDITTEDFKDIYVQAFRMINNNEAEMIIRGYHSASQPARMYYATYNLATKTLNKYKSDLYYDEAIFRMQDWTYENGKFYIAVAESPRNACWSLTVELDKTAKRVKVIKNQLNIQPVAPSAQVRGIFVRDGNIFITGDQGGKNSYWQNGEWIEPTFQGERNDFITDILYLP
nr:hypothetical protein [Pedobacter sp. ASV19]